MTNKLFIVKYVFVDIDICEKIDERVIDKNLSTSLDRRESFDDIAFETIFAQNICFFDVVENIANKINKINKIEINKIVKNVEDEVNDEVSDEITSDFENKTISLNTNETNSLKDEVNICFKNFVTNLF